MLDAAGFVALGIAIGAVGTLIGAGGGFILLPILLLLFPTEATGRLTATSLAVVAANASSGALAYGRQRRIDLRSAVAFAIATLPGSVAGAFLARSLPRGPFDVAFALILVALALLVVRVRPDQGPPAPEGRAWGRELIDRAGTVYRYHPRLRLGIAISFVVGFASSLLGIGGGFILVPALVTAVGFPVHVATATSQLVLAIMAIVGTLTHVAAGDLDGVWPRVLWLGLGAVVGAQAGARLATRIGGTAILKLLAAALVVVALRLAVQGLLGV